MSDRDPAVAIWEEILPEGIDTLGGDRVSFGHTIEPKEDSPMNYHRVRRMLGVSAALAGLLVVAITLITSNARAGVPDTAHSPIVKVHVIQCAEQTHANGNVTINKCRDAEKLPYWAKRACPTEDSVNCHWDAQKRGNGRGHSFLVRQFPGSAHMVCVTYVQRHYAKRHDYCT